MHRESTPLNGKTPSDASSARPRRLGIEKLELRSILAAVAGMPENLHSLSGAELSGPELPGPEIEFQSTLNRRFRNLQLMEGGPITMVGLTTEIPNASLTSDAELTQPFAFQTTGSEKWTSLRENAVVSARIIDSLPLDSADFDSTWQFHAGDNWFPMFRQPWISHNQELDSNSDQPLNDHPWASGDANLDIAANNSSSDMSTSDPIRESLDSHSESSAPAPPTSSDLSGPAQNKQLPSWSEFDDSPLAMSGSIRQFTPHSTTVRREGLATLTMSLNLQMQEDEIIGIEAERRQPAGEDLSGGLLELPAERVSRTTARRVVDKHDSPANATLRQYSFPYSSSSDATYSQAINERSEAHPSPEVFVEFDEGGLVELFAIAAVRGAPASKTPSAAPLNRGLIDAEVGLFQTIDVASSLAAEPSQAALYPAILIAAFQLFDQRRKVAQIEDEYLLH